MNKKYRCPKCGSSNIIYWVEYVMEKHYKLSEKGERYKKAFKTFDNGAEGHEGLHCQDCNNYVNWIDSIDAKDWSKENSLPNR